MLLVDCIIQDCFIEDRIFAMIWQMHLGMRMLNPNVLKPQGQLFLCKKTTLRLSLVVLGFELSCQIDKKQARVRQHLSHCSQGFEIIAHDLIAFENINVANLGTGNHVA